MEIKPSLRSKIETIFIAIVGVFLCFVIYDPDYILAISITFVAYELFVLKAWAVYHRTIKMDKDGCTVSFLWFKKTYLWDELKTKHVEKNYDQRIGNRYWYYKKGVVFSKKENFKTPEFLDIFAYMNVCLNPFSFFVVLFKPDPPKESAGIYEVDEAEFMAKMEEFGVVLN